MCTPNHKLILLDTESTGNLKRVYELCMQERKVYCAYAGTWCELFKSKGFKKSVKHREKINERINKFILKDNPTAKYKQLEPIGSRFSRDIHNKTRQRFLLKLEF